MHRHVLLSICVCNGRGTQRAIEARSPPGKETLKGLYCQKIRLSAKVLIALPNQAVGDEGLEQRLHFPRKSNNGPVRDAEYDARCADSGVIDPDLEDLIRAWHSLSESVRKEILKHLPP